MKPFYGRVGGKTKSVNKLINILPADYDVYVEPFFGGGSIFFRKPFIDKL